ncbi:uncharacterized protein A4U43_C09F7820 [Asparagus officinalis]|uniref:Uncharacterized protein n=1 Tax=Asparagus officinalis TaxID=4686 RepID=A0A5P1E611_ASPOF|nr:uncharacterized protein A4U43_C09F7820 [Asparagus officinalis]
MEAAPSAANPPATEATAARKRYERLMTIRSKAIKGKGGLGIAAHLRALPPPLGLRRATAAPARTSTPPPPSALFVCGPHTISSAPPLTRKRLLEAQAAALLLPALQRRSTESSPAGKEDLGALAMLEDSVKRLKNPKPLRLSRCLRPWPAFRRLFARRLGL